jgi:hypothetical protein
VAGKVSREDVAGRGGLAGREMCELDPGPIDGVAEGPEGPVMPDGPSEPDGAAPVSQARQGVEVNIWRKLVNSVWLAPPPPRIRYVLPRSEPYWALRPKLVLLPGKCAP